MITVPKDKIDITAIWLRREGDHVIVLVERDGAWVEVIREYYEGPFSHIVEPGGIRSALSKATAP